MSNSTVANGILIGFHDLRADTGPLAGLTRLADGCVFGSLLVLTVLVAIPYGTVEPWWIAVYEVSIFVLAAFAVVHSPLSRSQSMFASAGVSKLLLPAMLLVVFAFVQSATLAGPAAAGLRRSISADPYETHVWAVKLLAYIFYGALLFRYVSTQRRLRMLVYTVIGLGVMSAFFGLLRQALQHDTGFLLPHLQPNSGYGQFINKNHFTFLTDMALGLSLGLVLGGGVRRRVWPFLGAGMLMMWTAVVMTSSRGAIFTLLSQIIFLAPLVLLSRLRKQPPLNVNKRLLQLKSLRTIITSFVLVTVLLATVAISAVWLGGDLLARRMESLPREVSVETSEVHAGVLRREVWGSTLALIKAHPFAGSGFGAYGIAITRFHDGSGKWTPEAAHNDYLELAASGGLIAIMIACWFVFVFVRTALKQLRRRDQFGRAACLGAVAGLFGVAAHSLVDFGLHLTVNAVVLITLIVIATRAYGGEKKERLESSRGALHFENCNPTGLQ